MIESLNINYGVVDECFKYYRGVLFDSSKRQIRNFPEALWDKYPNHNLVPQGRDVFKEKHINLISAKNDWVAFQTLITLAVPFVLSKTSKLTLSSIQGYRCIRLAPWCESKEINIEINIEALVEDNDRSKKADLLLKKESVEYDAYQVAIAWIELKIPKDISPQIYKGGINIYVSLGIGDEEFIGEVTFETEVKNVILPEKSESIFELDLWQHNSIIARHYEVERYQDAHFEILKHYVASLADLGQKCISIIASDAPWAGQTCHRLDDGSNTYEYNIIEIEKEINGNFNYDYTKMQRYIDLCFQYGIDKWIKIFGLVAVWADPEYGLGNPTDDYPDALKLRYHDKADGKMKIMKKGTDIDQYIRSLQNYFIDNGLIDKVLLSADEPMDFEYYSIIIERIKKIAPEFRFFAAINHTEHIELCQADVDNFCMILPSVTQEWDKISYYKSIYNKIYTWYVCCGPAYPNMFLRSNLLETRLVGILTEYLGLHGFLRWNYTVWNTNPKQSLCWHLFPAGDNCFVYPGEDGKPLLSLRYKQLKRAIEDFMLIDMLKKKNNELALQVLNNAYTSLFKFSTQKDLVISNNSAADMFNLEFNNFQNMKIDILTALEN